MKICPRCFGNHAIVCCALCEDARVVYDALEKEYTQSKFRSVGDSIKLREKYKAALIAINKYIKARDEALS